ncbi:uncharacterized protein LOC115925908 [Strongylocentrotus purpuratus]|uniref:Uncharacterized protein n=1 Tax=Strongylocentrotus purpuratus TaxID=7668 RepID=A0A7M7P4C7_STRPU|nr:uncharacterized protein LOC115925908 [Strongylocentrotus purpuratus]
MLSSQYFNRKLDRDTQSHQATRKYIIISQNSARIPHQNQTLKMASKTMIALYFLIALAVAASVFVQEDEIENSAALSAEENHISVTEDGVCDGLSGNAKDLCLHGGAQGK